MEISKKRILYFVSLLYREKYNMFNKYYSDWLDEINSLFNLFFNVKITSNNNCNMKSINKAKHLRIW